MDRTEPTLIPEWLKNSSSSQSHSDDISASRFSKNKFSVHSNGHDFGRNSGFERTASSSYFRRGSGNSRSYSSSGRNQRDRDWERDKFSPRDQEKPFFEDSRHLEFSVPEKTPVLSRFDKDGFRRSRSLVSGKRGDALPKKVDADHSPDGLVSSVSSPSRVNKTLFERDFPSLGSEERLAHPDVGRVPSPGLTSAIQSLPIGSSTSLGEKWTSALAEVPVLVGSSVSSASQTASSSSSSSSAVLGSTTGLNMAEAVTHGPVRPLASPQFSSGAQRREELAIKQSRQLIPVTPPMPKALALNSSDKPKVKSGPAAAAAAAAASVPATHSPRGVSVKVVDASVSGKLHVLKPAREKNGLSASGGKDSTSPTSSGKAGTSSAAVAPPPPATSGNQTTNSWDRKQPASSTVLEKRPTSQAQSRNEFFNTVRKKSLERRRPPTTPDQHSETNAPAEIPRGAVGADTSDLSEEEEEEEEEEAASKCDGEPYDPAISEEEEAAFLRSLGWDENDEEEGGLTEEEISSFRTNLTKYVESNPSLRILQGTQLRFLLPLESKGGKV